MKQTTLIGTQQVLSLEDIGPPDYEFYDWQVDEVMECLLDQAIKTGETVSQAHIARGEGPAPFAHQGCTSYHAIQVIRLLEHRVAELQHRLTEINTRHIKDDA